MLVDAGMVKKQAGLSGGDRFQAFPGMGDDQVTVPDHESEQEGFGQVLLAGMGGLVVHGPDNLSPRKLAIHHQDKE
jgi:hypothetical protein